MTNGIEGSVAIVTGGSRGQGAAEARALVEHGAHVVIADVLDTDGVALAKELGANARFVSLDVRSAADWQKGIDVAESLGPVRILVNNAGVHRDSLLVDESPQEFWRVVDTNLVGAFLGIQHVHGPMVAAGGGSIVNIGSASGLLGVEGRSAYGSSKWGLRGLTKVAAAELADDGIRVNCVLPGPVDTEMLSEAAKATLRNVIPLGQLVTSDQVAAAVVFLCSHASTYMTGSEIAVDGGVSAVGPSFGMRP
jgi:3alpha(or 20beta)-hydroxysteroid dehydrogenase